jgi:hypothetical protein
MCTSQNIAEALSFAKEEELKVFRTGWKDGFHLEVVRPSTNHSEEPLIFLVTPGGDRTPWAPTHQDLLASDWMVNYKDADLQAGLDSERRELHPRGD